MSSFDFTSFGDAKIAVVRPIDVRREQEGVRQLNQEKGDDSSKQHHDDGSFALLEDRSCSEK